MKIKLILLLVIPPLLGISTFCIMSGKATQIWRSWTTSDPIIEFPSTLDLGQRLHGEVLVTRFPIANRGRAELLIDEVQSNCVCSGLERENNGHVATVESVCLQPGEEIELGLRLTVKGRPGASMATAISFRTNDPNHPIATIQPIVSWVTGGISTEPTTVLFGKVQTGTVAKQVVEVWDDSVKHRALKHVSSTAPERIATQVIQLQKSPLPVNGKKSKWLLGRIEVNLNTKESGTIREELLISSDDTDSPPTRVRILGQVVPLVQVLPSALEFPRFSEKGPVYVAEVIAHASEGPLALAVEHSPPGVSVSFAPFGNQPNLRRVRIDARNKARQGGPEDQAFVVRLQAHSHDRAISIPVAVHLNTMADR